MEISPLFFGTGQPNGLEMFTGLYYQVVKGCAVELCRWFKPQGGQWQDIDVLAFGRDAVYIIQCTEWAGFTRKGFDKILHSFEPRKEYVMQSCEGLKEYKNIRKVLAVQGFSESESGQKRRKMFKKNGIEVLTFEDMANELIWFMNKYFKGRDSLIAKNPLMWLLRALIWNDFLVEEAWYPRNWKRIRTSLSASCMNELWRKTEDLVYGKKRARKFKGNLWCFVQEAARHYLECDEGLKKYLKG